MIPIPHVEKTAVAETKTIGHLRSKHRQCGLQNFIRDMIAELSWCSEFTSAINQLCMAFDGVFQYRVFQRRCVTHEVYVGEDGYTKSALVSSPRLHGLFGANNGGNEKRHPTTTSKPDETKFLSTTIPPTIPGLSFPAHSNHFPGMGT